VKKAAVAALLIIVAIPLLIGVAELPPHGASDTPAYTRISAYYLANGLEEAGTENIVTAVILNYRGLDTNGEVTVIFTGLAAAFAVLLPAALVRRSHPASSATAAHVGSEQSAPVSPIVSFIVRLLAPFIALFSLYVMFHGHSSPGGGFQAGAILGGLFIVLSVVLGSQKVRPLLDSRLAPWLRIAGPIGFVTMGVLGAALTGYYLGFTQVEALHWVRSAMVMAIEIGIGVGGAMIFATLFAEMEAQ
jgi:multicomponent Na+:H+ antiporter subunit B